MPLVPRNLNLKFRRAGGGKHRSSVFRFAENLNLRIAAGPILPWTAIKTPFSKTVLPVFLLVLSFAFSSFGDVRLRDLVMVSGARDNQLVGYGVVVGVPGDGDKDPLYTQQTIANMLRRYGINLPATTLSAKNIAVVMVTADIPAFSKPGVRIDVQVASMGNAVSIQGGVLLQTPLLGADNKVYAVAQGSLVVGGFAAGTGGPGGATTS